jgi:hypothetical protein
MVATLRVPNPWPLLSFGMKFTIREMAADVRSMKVAPWTILRTIMAGTVKTHR